MSERSTRADRRSEAIPPTAGSPGWQELPEGVKLGDLCYQAERYADALEAYGGVLKEADKLRLPRELAARLHYRMACCYLRRSSYRQALDHLDLAREILPRHLDKTRLAKIYAKRGHVLQEMGHYVRAERYLTWAQKLLSGTNEHEELAGIETYLGMVHGRLGHAAEAKRCFLSALTTYRRIGDLRGEAGALNNLGIQYKNACEWREAIRYLEEARTLFQRVGNRLFLAYAGLNLGIVHMKLGKWDLCEENLTTAERIACEMGAKLPIVRIQLAQGNLELRRRRWVEAQRLYETAKTAADAGGYQREAILAREFLGELAVDRGDYDQAALILTACLEDARRIAPDGDLVNEILRRLAEARLAQGRHAEALECAKESASAASRIGDRYEEAVALRAVGLATMYLGRREEGERIVGLCLDTLAEVGETYQKAVTHLAYARYLAAQAEAGEDLGELERAGVQFQRAYGAYLDLDARVQAATSVFERARLECRFRRFEEAAALRGKARQVLPLGESPELERELEALGIGLEDAFADRWLSETDVLTSLGEMKRLFQGASDSEGVLRELLRLAVTRSDSARGCVGHVEHGGRLVIAAAYGWEPEEANRLLDALGPSLLTVLRESRPVWCNQTDEDDRFQAVSAGSPFATRSLVVLPLNLTEERPGFLYVDRSGAQETPGYHRGEVHLLGILAHLAALSILERWNHDLSRENAVLKARLDQGLRDSRFVTENPVLQNTLRLLTKVANSPVSILIEGETGTGKGLLAQIIHDASDRKGKPFVQINCAALPEQLLESELFGHVKGAFTGAAYNKVGLFKEAEDGTLFLDEVDKTTLAVQAKLLHVLDTKEVRPVGSVKGHRVDTRVICATNTNLRERIQSGEFLEDLYYRLNDFIVTVPPLRERREDVPLLIDYFLERFRAQYKRPEVTLGLDARRALLECSWRGNVRELEKTIRRLVVLGEDGVPVGLSLLPREIMQDEAPTSGPITLRDEVSRTERRVISEALRTHHGNKTQVARELKVSYPCLLKKIREHGLETRSSA